MLSFKYCQTYIIQYIIQWWHIMEYNGGITEYNGGTLWSTMVELRNTMVAHYGVQWWNYGIQWWHIMEYNGGITEYNSGIVALRNTMVALWSTMVE